MIHESYEKTNKISDVYKKSVWGDFYVRLVTKKPYFFLSYIVLGFALILFIMLHTQIDVVEIYTAEVENVEGVIHLYFQEDISPPNGDTIYLYAVKNEVVYPVKIDSEFNLNDDNSTAREFLLSHIGDFITVEIPVRKISLLEHIFVKGGKSF